MVFKPLTGSIPGFGAILVSLNEPVCTSPFTHPITFISLYPHIHQEMHSSGGKKQEALSNLTAFHSLWLPKAWFKEQGSFCVLGVPDCWAARAWVRSQIFGWRHCCSPRCGEDDWCKLCYILPFSVHQQLAISESSSSDLWINNFLIYLFSSLNVSFWQGSSATQICGLKFQFVLSFFFPGTELNQDCIDRFNGLAKPHCGSNDGRRLQVLYTSFFLKKIGKISPKGKIKTSKFNWFWRFLIARREGKNQ